MNKEQRYIEIKKQIRNTTEDMLDYILDTGNDIGRESLEYIQNMLTINKKRKTIMKFDMEFESFNFVVEVIHYVPYREAPYCSDPTNQEYSDCGDPEELEYVLWLKDNNGNIELIPDSLSILYNKTYQYVLEEVKEKI